MAEHMKKAWGYRHVVVVVLWFIYIINYFDRISVLVFLPYIQKDLNLTTVQIGWLGSIFFFGYSLSQILAGYLADRIGPKRATSISIWSFTLVTFITGLVQSFWQFFFLRLALALGEAQDYVPGVRMIANWFPRRELNRAVGFLSSGVTIAPAICPIVVTQLAMAFGGNWRPVFFCLAVPGVIGIWLLTKFLSDWPDKMLAKGRVKQEEYNLITTDSKASGHEKTYSVKMFLTDSQFYIYASGLFITLMIYWGVAVWISTFLVKQHGMDMKTMGFFSAVPYVVAFFSMNFGGWMADKWFKRHPKYLTIISFLGCVPVYYFLGHVSKGNTPMLLLALALAGFFIHLQFGHMFSYPTRRYPKELVGRASGVSNCIGQFGAFVSPLVAGYLVVTLPDNSLNFANVFLFWSLLAIVGAIIIAFLKENYIEETANVESTESVV
ncbi:MAG: MFS transporter [Desulfomonilaceae bacterium]